MDMVVLSLAIIEPEKILKLLTHCVFDDCESQLDAYEA